MPTEWTSVTVSTTPAISYSKIVFASGEPVTFWGDQSQVMRATVTESTIGLGYAPGQVAELKPASGEEGLLILRVGKLTPADQAAWLAAGGHLFEAMKSFKIDNILLPPAETFGGSEALFALLSGALSHSYRHKTLRNIEQDHHWLKAIIVDPSDHAISEDAVRASAAVNRARAWVDQPANLLTPPVFASEAEAALGRLGANVWTIGPADLERIGARLLAAIGRGSEFGAQMFIAEWRGDPDREGWDAVLVGKGLTFDAGGLNLKARPIISKMKLDMAGGAAVLGALELAITRKARVNVAVIVAMSENNIDALSFRPGDVLQSLSGLSVEVADTDAEGRLALADAMTYGVRKYAPSWLIDVATLTGQIVGTLHEEFAGLFASDDMLARALLDAGEETGDRLWRLPLDKSHDYLVESEQADIVNLGPAGLFGNGFGSPIAGAKFLERFTQGTKWAHIDMAGTAVASRATSSRGKGATGYGVRLLDRWLSSIETS